MRRRLRPAVLVPALAAQFLVTPAPAPAQTPTRLPKVADGWAIERVVGASEIAYPTAAVSAPDGTTYLGQDPMDMPGPPTEPIDSVVAVKGGAVRVFADKLWAVMGLEWVDGALVVVNAPYLSSFRDTDGDGKADRRIDLVTGLGPKLPGFNGLNDHVASGVRLGMDGFLYVAVGDKGLPEAVGADGAKVRLRGGGVIRVRPDGSGLEVVSTGERNPLSVAINAADELFTYGNDDDSKQWPNSLTHHVVGGHYGYPYEFLAAPTRALPVIDGRLGGSGTQGTCFEEDGLPASYRGNLFFCDWGLQRVDRYEVARDGATYRVRSRTPFVTKGDLDDFRPFSIVVNADRASFTLVDWAYNGWLAAGPKAGRLYRLTYQGPDRVAPAARPSLETAGEQVAALDHPARSVRLDAQRALIRRGAREIGPLAARLRAGTVTNHVGTRQALWAVDGLGTPESRGAVREALHAAEGEVRSQAARSVGVRRDRDALVDLVTLLGDRDPVVRREAAVALGRIGDPRAAAGLLDSLGETDAVVAWSIRRALRTIDACPVEPLVAALRDRARRDGALKFCDENWSPAVVEALRRAGDGMGPPADRARLIGTLAGLYRKYPAWSGQWFGTNPLAGRPPEKTEPWDSATMARVQAALTAALGDPDAAVRLRATAGLFQVGPPAAPALRRLLTTETDPANLAAVARGLGVLVDTASASALGKLVSDPKRPDSVRAAALDALGPLRGPVALNARLSLVYDPEAPAALVARALPGLGRGGVIPPNDLVGFLGHADASVRAAALAALASRKALKDDVAAAVLACLDDADPAVRREAVAAVAAVGLRGATPKLLAAALNAETRTEATLALAALPDARAVPVYLAALLDRSPDVRRAGESALFAVRDEVASDLARAAKSGRYGGHAGLALERVVCRFRPVREWQVIGPFPRTTAPLFFGAATIDHSRPKTGANGRTVRWAARSADGTTGRVLLEDLKGAGIAPSAFGYEAGNSPELAAFAAAEVESPADREALLLCGSSGSLIVALNGEVVVNASHPAGRPFRPDDDAVRVRLRKGANRILVQSRQGIGAWAFEVRVAEPASTQVAGAPAAGLEALRAFALAHAGDPRGGESIFFDAKGVGCVNCHAAGGRGVATVGPDLTGLALKYDKAEIIQSVLRPSARIATGYQPVLVAAADGTVHNGLIREETATTLDLVDASGKLTRLDKASILERRVGDVSIMPAGLVDGLTVVEFADLMSYLQTLREAPAPTPKN